MDLHDESTKPEEDDLFQYLNEQIRVLYEQIVVATKDERLDTKKDYPLNSVKTQKTTLLTKSKIGTGEKK